MKLFHAFDEIFSKINSRIFTYLASMEIKYLRLILTIAEEGSIVDSADRLFLTQSALSHQLREIEERLGFKIFIRSRKKWHLTSEGQELHSLANKVIRDIEAGMQKIENIKDGSKGEIRLSTACYSFYQGIPQFVQKMALLYPEINIKLNIQDTHHPVSKLLSNELDMAITSDRCEHADLENKLLFKDEMFIILHEEHKLAQYDHLEAKALSDEHLIIHSYPLETVTIYERFLKPNRIEPKNITAIPMTEVALDMVQANMGIMCMPKWALSSFNLSDAVVMRQIGKDGLKRKNYLIFRKQDRFKKYMADFIQNVEEMFLDKVKN